MTHMNTRTHHTLTVAVAVSESERAYTPNAVEFRRKANEESRITDPKEEKGQ
jgi:hypothetical protein